MTKAEKAEYNKDWRMRNPGYHLTYQSAWREKKRNEVQELAAARGCEKCGATEDLHWHHVDPDTKAGKVMHLASNGSLQALGEEIAKCSVLCGTCHREEHK